MIKKIIFFIFLLYLLVLIQTSFMVHFRIFGVVLNLILIAIIFINLFIPARHWQGIFIAFLGGFYLDIFSIGATEFFGFYTLIAVLISLFIKLFLKRYVQIPIIKKV